MCHRRFGIVSLAAVFVLLLAAATSHAAVTSRDKPLAEPRDDKGLIYFIRPLKWVGGGRTMFVYADQTFLGVLEINSYTFAHLDPGHHLLWLNWAKITHEIEVEPGTVRYFWIYDHFSELDEVEGQRRIREAGFYTTPTEKESGTAKLHILQRFDTALGYAGVDTSRTAGPKDRNVKLERRVAKWPDVDLTPYSILYIQDFAVTDPKAVERKNQDYVETAPQRLADFVTGDLAAGLFDEVRRGSPDGEVSDAVVLQVDLTRYRPALYGKGSAAYIDFAVRLVDGGSGKVIGRVDQKRGSGFGIDKLESIVGRELSIFLEKCKGGAATSPGDATPGSEEAP